MSTEESAVSAHFGLRREFVDLDLRDHGTLEFEAVADEEPALVGRHPLAANGRHVAPARPSAGQGRRLIVFGLIGAFIFVMGLAMQAALTGKFHMPADASYVTQGVISLELSFVLNRWLTWRDRDVRFWPAFGRYNLQKAITSVVNLAAYAGLVWLGVNYLIANIALVGVFSAINYVAGDVLVFTRLRGVHRPSSKPRTQSASAEQTLATRTADVATPVQMDWLPAVSVVIPCKASQRTIRATVESMLTQDYPNLLEVICVGDVGDPTWDALEGISDGRLVLHEYEPQPGKREPNAKRDEGVLKSAGDVIALADSDIVMDQCWLSRAVALLDAQGREGLVAGGMRSVHDSFWGTFVDANQLAAKTPRLPRPYQVTAENFGKRGFKPPITANAVFLRTMYDTTPLDAGWSYGYEDYEWFWRVVSHGHKVLFSGDLTASHHHRRSFRDLAREYRLSAQGCAAFVRTYGDCPLSRKRMLQAVALPLALLAVLAGVAVAAEHHLWLPLLAALVGCWALVTCREVARARTPAALAYPFIAFPLGMLYTFALGRGLVTSRPEYSSVRGWESERDTRERESHRRGTGSRIYWPIVAVLAVQAGFSLSLVWSNTAFGDEGNYLWQGRLEWAHWLHGAPLPTFNDSGVPALYPPIGALASAIGGLAGARILSMLFMLVGTLLLFQIGSTLFGRRAAVAGAALWAVSEPVLRLAFATYDPLSCMLIIASVWLAVQAGKRRRCGELVALCGVTLALASAITFSFAIYVPAAIIISFLIWIEMLGRRLAIWCAAWLVGVILLMFVGTVTLTHGWVDFIGSTITRSGNSNSLGYAVSQVVSSAWSWDGLIFAVALAGVVAAFYFERLAHRRLLVLALALSGVLVVAYQAHLGSSWAMDKHVSAGSGFMALAAGYAVGRIRSPWKHATAWCVSAALMCYPAFTGLWYAREAFHSWPNTGALVSYLQAKSRGDSYLIVGAPGGVYATLQYALPQATNVTEASSSKDPADDSYAAIILTVGGTFNSVPLTGAAATTSGLGRKMLALARSSSSSSNPVLGTQLEKSSYRLAGIFPYSTTFEGSGAFLVWLPTRGAR